MTKVENFLRSALLWNGFKYFLTIFIIIQVPIYWHYYGFENFLWLSDIGLFLTAIALWDKSRKIMSFAAVGIFVVEFVWAIDFFVDLFLNINLIDLSDYMFDTKYPLFLRLISLFHILTPSMWILYLREFGYYKKAVYYFVIFYWINITLVYFFTTPSENINWVFVPTVHKWSSISQEIWVILLMVLYPALIVLPTHYIFKKLFKLKNR